MFTKVVETGGFTAASKALGVPKSTVSRRVAVLERRLGATLLHRTTRRVRLTDAGAAYYERCSRMIAELDAAETVISELESEPRGKLRVTAPMDMGAAVLGGLAIDFLNRYPEIDLDLVLLDRIVNLIEEGIDVAVRPTLLGDSNVVARKIARLRVFVCASPDYVARQGAPATPDELKDHPCITRSGPALSRSWPFRGPDGPIDVQVSPRLAVDDYTIVRDATVAGLGVAFIPWVHCRHELESGRLVTVLDDYELRGSSIYAVYPKGRSTSAKVRAFLDFLSERADAFGPPASAAAPARGGASSPS